MPPAPPSPPAAAQPPPPRKRGRGLILGVGAVAALVVGIGAPTFDRYLFYKSGQPTPTIHVVAAGQSSTWEHVTWKAALEPVPAPAESKHNTPDKQFLKITITRTAIDKDGTVLTAKPKLSLQDRQERKWQVEVYENNTPTDPGEVGKPYTLIAVAVVPTAVSKEVELHLEPDSVYRMNTPTADLMKVSEEDMAKTRRMDTLVFRR